MDGIVGRVPMWNAETRMSLRLKVKFSCPTAGQLLIIMETENQ